MVVATQHSIPVNEDPKGHVESRNCPCEPRIVTMSGGRMVHHRYMNNEEYKGSDGN